MSDPSLNHLAEKAKIQRTVTIIRSVDSTLRL